MRGYFHAIYSTIVKDMQGIIIAHARTISIKFKSSCCDCRRKINNAINARTKCIESIALAQRIASFSSPIGQAMYLTKSGQRFDGGFVLTLFRLIWVVFMCCKPHNGNGFDYTSTHSCLVDTSVRG